MSEDEEEERYEKMSEDEDPTWLPSTKGVKRKMIVKTLKFKKKKLKT
jgi:hypothetical protein